MSDWLIKLASDRYGARLAAALKLPVPVPLERAAGGFSERPLTGLRFRSGATPGGRIGARLAELLASYGATPATGDERVNVIAFDATGLSGADDLRALYTFFQPTIGDLAKRGHVVVFADDPAGVAAPVGSGLARGIEGFVRSLAKELGRRGATANLVYVAADALDRIDFPLRFFTSAHSAFVDGQAITVNAAAPAPPALPTTRVLEGKVAIVTGAARGIGEACAERLAEEGAKVVCVDIPKDAAALAEVASRIGGLSLGLDVTAPDATKALETFVRDHAGGVDVIVHSAGITRDRTLAKMPIDGWDAVIAVNFSAVAAIDEALLSSGLLRDHARVVAISSIGGIAGNFGQTNYAATKAALVGYAAARAHQTASRGITFNTVAPGFIETRMTAKVPAFTREAGRRLSSLTQGGLPRDIAEAVAFLASPGAYGVTGRTLRACGQSLLGA